MQVFLTGGSSLPYRYKVGLEYVFSIDKIRTCPRFFSKLRLCQRDIEGLKLRSPTSLSKAGLGCVLVAHRSDSVDKFWETIPALVAFCCKGKQRDFSSKLLWLFIVCICKLFIAKWVSVVILKEKNICCSYIHWLISEGGISRRSRQSAG